jgi:N-acetylmuramoyl-L-alanine amidase
MLQSLIDDVRALSVLWRHRLTMYWRIGSRDNLAFGAMVMTPLVALGAIVYLAYSDDTVKRVNAAQQRALDIHCLAENIYFEARGEPERGQYAIAEVTMNRRASPHFPDTICEVVHDTRWDRLRRRLVAHFSWTQQLLKRKDPTGPAWDRALKIATAVHDNAYVPVVPHALHYHAADVRPYWAESKRRIAVIGNHVFYR